jgi:hypothetical protein
MRKNTGPMSEHTHGLFLSSLTSIHVKNSRTYFLTYPRT